MSTYDGRIPEPPYPTPQDEIERLAQELAKAREQLAAREDEIAAKVLDEAASWFSKQEGNDPLWMEQQLRRMAQERRNRGKS